MRRFLAGCALAAMMPLAVGAQEQPGWSIAGGLSLPLGDFGDVFDAGFGVHGSYWKPLAGKTITLRLDAGFDRFSGPSVLGFSSSATAFPIMGNAVLRFGADAKEGTARPYVFGGAGVLISRTSVGVRVGSVSRSESRTSTDPGIQLGGGVEFMLAGFSTFAEARLVNGFGDDFRTARYIPLMFGVKF
jgi:opacity protein-like surface antigen